MRKKIVIMLIALLTIPSIVLAKDTFKPATLYKSADRVAVYSKAEADFYFGYGYKLETVSMLGANGDPFQPSNISISIREGLVAGAARTQTTLNIDPIVTLDGHRETMADFGCSPSFAKIDQGTSNEEIISFTGITDNTSYFTLTGVSWGYNFWNASSSISANKKKHNSGASFKIATDFHFINGCYISLSTTQTVTGTKTFTVFPQMATSTSVPTTNGQFATKYYTDITGASGITVSNASTTQGIQAFAGSPVTLGVKASSTGALAIDTSGNLYVNASSTKGINIQSDGSLAFSGLTIDNTWTGTNIFTGTSTLNNYIQVTASTTLALNEAVMISTVTGSLIKSFASTTGPGAGNDYGFLGFAKQAATNGSSTYVQIAGVVSGLSGLTPGAEYYISSSTAGAIVSVLGNAMFPIRIGRALSATTLLLERIKVTGYAISKTKGSTYTAETDGIANVITVNNGSCNITSNGIILSRVGSATYAYMNCTAPIYKGSVYTLNADADLSSVAYFTPIN